MFFAYEGRAQTEAEANSYTLAIPGNPLFGESDHVLYVDGTPSSTSLLGGMNEFIWDSKMNQFEFTEYGFVRALRDVAKGDCCYIGYGPEYDWDEYKTQLAHELAAALLLGATLFGHPSFEPVMSALLGQVVGWTKLSLPIKREGTGFERLFMSVVDGTTPYSSRCIPRSLWRKTFLNQSVAGSSVSCAAMLSTTGTPSGKPMTHA